MMKRNSITKMLLSVIGVLVLVAAMALSIVGCGSKTEAPANQAESKTFTFLVVDGNGKETSTQVTTQQKTVGQALLEKDLVAGEDSEYGLYVKTVNGITADYDVDGTYWGFYVNGEYAVTGVDSTDVEDGATYMFKLEGAAPAETQAAEAQENVLGQGSTAFTFIAVDLEGQETKFEIHTDAATLGDALLENGLIEGEMGQYGLYVTSVNGIPLDWEKDGKYWSLLIDGEYAMTGVDSTEITAGTTYTFLPA